MGEAEFLATLMNRIDLVEQRVAAACKRAGRERSEVRIVAVTKTLSVAGVRLVPECGLALLGESRPQDLWKKAAASVGVTWHFIGHLQRNKIDKTFGLAAMFHSVDSVRLLQALDAEAGRQNKTGEVLIEVNASGEATKQGFSPAEVTQLVPEFDAVKNLRVRGLMTMAAPLPDPEGCRPTFASLRKLRDEIKPRMSPRHQFGELSMGMSNDFDVAIEEGATLVRLGSVYFEGIEI